MLCFRKVLQALIYHNYGRYLGTRLLRLYWLCEFHFPGIWYSNDFKENEGKKEANFSDMIHLTKNLTCYRDLVWKIAINIGQKLYKQSQFLKYCV